MLQAINHNGLDDEVEKEVFRFFSGSAAQTKNDHGYAHSSHIAQHSSDILDLKPECYTFNNIHLVRGFYLDVFLHCTAM